jgi:hypothetical protein
MQFNLAAAQGDASAVKARKEIEEHMTAAQIAKAEKLARDWKPSSHRLDVAHGA